MRSLSALSVVGGAVATHDACSTVEGMIVGADSMESHNAVASAGACCDLCHSNSECVAFTYIVSGKQCYLKDNWQGNKTQDDRISGTVPGRNPADHWNACSGNSSSLPFCDESLPQEQRLRDLVKRIQLDETGPQLTARQSPRIGRLDLPAYYWGTNAIHGLQNVQCLSDGQCPTSFPAPCAMAATFNMDNVEAMGQILGTEERAYFNEQVHDSLDTWSPTINLNRDPRWGRNVESAGEDPLLCGLFGAAYTKGLQQEGEDKYLQAVVTIKHWMSYTVESYHGTTRHNVDSNVSAWDMVHSYFPQWEIVVKEAGARGVMCSYNMVNGKPTCGNPAVADILRKDFGFKGYITSDTDSCADIHTSHKYVKTGEEAVRECLEGGTDIDSGSTYAKYLKSAVDQKVVGQQYVDQALYNSYKVRFDLGLFDAEGAKSSKYASITKDVVGSAAHQAKSLTAAREAMVLLKNNQILPARRGLKVAVIGSSANTTSDLLGNYNGPICPGGGYSCFPTVYQEVARVSGGSVSLYTGSDPSAAAALAAAADFAVLMASNAKDGGGEGHDRDSIGLDSKQAAVMAAALAAQPSAALVLVNGGIIAIDGLKDSAPAIIDAFMPGVHGAQAIAETLFGDNNPGGKMPVTMYPSSYVDEVDFLDMSMVAGPGRSYKFYTGTPLFPFGFGLSYTTFAHQVSSSELTLSTTDSVPLEVTVSNTGDRDGDEVVFVYMTNETSVQLDSPMPFKQLVAFRRVRVAAGAIATVSLDISAYRLAHVDGRGEKATHPGDYTLQVDRGHGDVVKVLTKVTGDKQVHFALKKWWGEDSVLV